MATLAQTLTGIFGPAGVIERSAPQGYDLASGVSSTGEGVATTVLPDAPTSFYWDRVSVVDVQLREGALASATEEAVLAGENTATLGEEKLGFVNVVPLGPGLYRLSFLFRGIGDTPTTGHAVGDVLDLSDLFPVQLAPPEAYRLDQVNGTSIQQNDFRVFMAAKGAVTPNHATDRLRFDGQVYDIVTVTPIMSGEQAAGYELQCRS